MKISAFFMENVGDLILGNSREISNSSDPISNSKDPDRVPNTWKTLIICKTPRIIRIEVDQISLSEYIKDPS